MNHILIDYDNIIKPNELPTLIGRIGVAPDTVHMIGLVLCLNEPVLKQLNSIELGNERVSFMNSQEFVDAIYDFSYLIYNKNKGVCGIVGLEKMHMLEHVVDSAMSGIPNDVYLTIGVSITDSELTNCVREFIKNGFCNPYICRSNTVGHVYKDYGICFFRANTLLDNQTNIDEVNDDISYVINEYKKNKVQNCKMSVVLSDKVIPFLKQICHTGSTFNNDGSISQKEAAGSLVVSSIDSELVHQMDVDRNTIVSGEEEGVSVSRGLYNFHSHPREAYERNNVKYGWPSAQDYYGFLSSFLNNNTIFHIVVTIEGVYILSITNEWIRRGSKLKNMKDFIFDNYSFKGSEKTIPWYIHHVNSIVYKKDPIFNVIYLPWANADTEFTVSFLKDGDNCFAREETLNKYNTYIKS